MDKVINKYKGEITEDTVQKINTLSSIIDSITFFDDNTIGITLNKNLIIYNNQNTINISKGYNVTIANKIQLNPEIDFKDIYQKPQEIQDTCDRAEEQKMEQLQFTSCKCNIEK